MTESAVEFTSVSKKYGQTTVVEDFNLAVESGKLVTLIGPSGCGKTTSLKMINRLIDPSSGTIYVEGEDVRQINPVDLRRNIGYVIQQIGLFPHMTIEQNVGLVPRLKGNSKRDLVRRTEELLDLIGLDPGDFRDRYPNELSGGQQQRIGVARALAANPSIVLMDEPFSALDPISREQLQDELIKLQSALHKTIVFVTHDMDEALKIADYIVLMRDGEVIQADAPDQFLRHPKDDFVREFVGEKRFQQASISYAAQDILVPAVTVAPGRGLAEAVRLMRRHKVNGLIVTNLDGTYGGVIGTQEIYENYGDESAKVSEIAKLDIPYVDAEADITSVMDLLEAGGRGYLPVLDSKRRLLGVITRSSLIDVLSSPYRQVESTSEESSPEGLPVEGLTSEDSNQGEVTHVE